MSSVSSTSLVSFIVPTKDSDRTLAACLESIRAQQGVAVELIVVDNHSTDQTVAIAQQFADEVLTIGPERSAQRNAGAAAATADYVVFIDSDMDLAPDIAREIVEQFSHNATDTCLVIPERVDGTGFWVKCRSIEKQMYLGDPRVEAARAFRRQIFIDAGGYDESLTGAEDWELPDRLVRNGGRVGRIESMVSHDEQGLTLFSTFRKKIYYGKGVAGFAANTAGGTKGRFARTNSLKRVGRFFVRQPIHVIGLFILKAVEVTGVLIGMAIARHAQNRNTKFPRTGSALQS